MFIKYRIDRLTDAPNCTARICLLNPDGSVSREHVETNNDKAEAMTNALENAVGGSKLGVDLGS